MTDAGSASDEVRTPLRTRALSLRKGGRLLIDGIDCTVPDGSLTALVGPNGAGKSSLLHVIAAIDAPSDGAVLLDGRDARGLRRKARARFTALVEQQADTDLDLTVREVVLLGRTPHVSALAGPGQADEEIAVSALARVGAAEFAGRRFAQLSGGERQRILLARALAQDPALLLVDEPTNHLDIRAQLQALGLLRALADNGMGVLAALHDLGLAARYADRVIVLDAGRVVAASSPAEVLTPSLIELVYGVRADVVAHPADGTPLIAFSPLDSAPTPEEASIHSDA
ncbi:ABC transporter ATP-binding protein [Microbacterium pseudoresistens]|uniref:Iron complex transport system ATP-binding protein n=1 Tax=Microbacterium pseudoresistens TaxID=640634 RepID=A0A7Y9EUU7_9MICO|nr:ABC transporter ATP-binding protein [Microbacterium pseudoresistens]NYD54392.1 iron complex transport system ATP-binding protein [Microbacterium pseudoresistens]